MLLEPAPPIVHLLRRVIQPEERHGDHMGGGATAAVQYRETSERYTLGRTFCGCEKRCNNQTFEKMLSFKKLLNKFGFRKEAFN